MVLNSQKQKRQASIFAPKRKSHDDPCLYLEGNKIKVVKEVKFSGIIFDSKLFFVPHIKMLKFFFTKALHVTKVIAHSKWGADKITLLHLYRSLVRSKLDIWIG